VRGVNKYPKQNKITKKDKVVNVNEIPIFLSSTIKRSNTEPAHGTSKKQCNNERPEKARLVARV
jgi:hypothetical protein